MGGSLLLSTVALSGGSASLTVSSLRVGPHIITATYIGNASFAASVSSPLQQSIAVPPDSLKLRELQVVGTRVAAQTSGDAISGTIAAAIEKGLSGDDSQLVTPSALGLRMTSAGYGDKDSKLPRSDWLVWSDLRQTSMTPGGGSSSGISGSQINSFAGLTLRVTSDFVAGVFVGYEFFGYDVSTLSGRLRGDGATGGAYCRLAIPAGASLRGRHCTLGDRIRSNCGRSYRRVLGDKDAVHNGACRHIQADASTRARAFGALLRPLKDRRRLSGWFRDPASLPRFFDGQDQRRRKVHLSPGLGGKRRDCTLSRRVCRHLLRQRQCGSTRADRPDHGRDLGTPDRRHCPRDRLWRAPHRGRRGWRSCSPRGL